MVSKLDRALGAFCIAFGAFFYLASRAMAPDDPSGLSRTASVMTLVIALLAAIPGIWLLVKGRSV